MRGDPTNIHPPPPSPPQYCGGAFGYFFFCLTIAINHEQKKKRIKENEFRMRTNSIIYMERLVSNSIAGACTSFLVMYCNKALI